MSFEIKGLLEKRATLIRECRGVSEKAEAENRNLNTEEQAADKKLNDEIDDLTSRVERLKRIEEAEKLLGTPANEAFRQGSTGEEKPITAKEQDLAFRGWALRSTRRPPSTAMVAAMERCKAPAINEVGIFGLCGLGYGEFRQSILRDIEHRANMNLTDATGGYTVPEGFVYNLEKALLLFGGPRQCAEVFKTTSGNDMPWPTANDTGNVGALLAEETTIGSSVAPTIAVRTFKAYKMSSTPILISTELLQDTAFDLGSEIAMMLGERIGRCEAAYYTTGTGSSQPQGCITGSTAATLSTGVATTASATAIAADEIIDLFHSVDPAYRDGPGVRFMFHDNIARYLRKLKDGDGNYLWNPGLSTALPDTLLGKRIQINQGMASAVTANLKTVQFGDYSKFKIRDVAEIRLLRLIERYADLDQVGFIAFHRTDSAVLDAGTKPLKHLVQHA